MIGVAPVEAGGNEVAGPAPVEAGGNGVADLEAPAVDDEAGVGVAGAFGVAETFGTGILL